MFPMDLDWLTLEDNEEVKWKGQPRIKSILPAVIFGLPLSIFGIGLLIIVGAYLNVKNTFYVVTTDGIYVKKGILSRNVKKIGYGKIQNISFSQGIFGNYFDYGNVNISTAGSEGVEMRLRSIIEPKKVQEMINRNIAGKEKGKSEEASQKELLQDILTQLEEINSKL